MAQTESEPPVPTITIKRDPSVHSWVFAGMGSHTVKIPWSDETPFDVVARYLKTRANGRLNVKPDLS